MHYSCNQGVEQPATMEIIPNIVLTQRRREMNLMCLSEDKVVISILLYELYASNEIR